MVTELIPTAKFGSNYIQHFSYNAVDAVRYLHFTHKIYTISVDNNFLHLLNKFLHLLNKFKVYI